MVEKISVQIALEGGEEIERQLADIGEAGQKAFADISKSAEQVGGFKNLKPEEVTQKLKDMGVTGVDAIEKIQKAVASARWLEGIVQGVATVETALLSLAKAAGVIGLVVSAVFAKMIKPTLAFAEAISKADQEAIKLGLSIEQFDRLRGGLEQAGLSAKAIGEGIATLKAELDKVQLERINTAFKELQDAATRGFGAQGTAQLKLLQEAAQGTGEAAELARRRLVELGLADPSEKLSATAEALKALGISATDVSTALPQIVEKLRQMPDGAQRTALAIQLFGKTAGAELVQALRTGGVAIDQFVQKQQQLTQDQANTANALEQSINRLSAAWGRFNSLAIAPALTAGIDAATASLGALQAAVNAIGGAFSGLSSPIQATVQELVGIGAALTNAFSGAMQPIQNTVRELSAIGQAITTAGSAVASFASSIAGISWDAIAGGAAAFNAVVQAIGAAGQAITSFISSLTGLSWDAISSVGVAAWDAITGAIGRAIDALLRFIGLKPSAPATGGSALGAARGGLIGGRGTGTSDSNLAWLSRGEFVVRAAAVRQLGTSFLNALNGGGIPGYAAGGPVAADKSGALVKMLIESSNAIRDAMLTYGDSVDRLMQQMRSDIQTLTQSMLRIQDRLLNAANDLQQARPSARGGLIGGRGTGTSDSNLAWLSRGEFVINAAMVRRFGASFFAALNAGMIPGFALGGLVPRPAFAAGGPVGSMSHVTIAFPGLPPIAGLRASASVVDELQRAAALAQVRSGGRKPSRYS
jgi:hypothetical protein